ncbi:hypothetical protein LSM04_008615 [Trypanosoma melophagium]|uniref:uncharacterized protein n=1 Tax=Trypanosoma melophagium TaxID=715481 RepID=UPI00351AAD89|nr:hypothetical protein LSM04_008615 [Trypanosoma melophagium]
MYLSGIIGSFLLLYAPLVICGVASAVYKPQLLVVALFGAGASLLSFLITGLFYNILLSLFPSYTNTSLFLATVVVIVHVAAAGALRVYLFTGLLRVEGYARVFGQLLNASPLRFAFVAVAAGCGFGALSALRGAGTLMDATRRLTFYTAGTTAYNMRICPQLPLLLHSTLQAFLMLFAQIAWAVMTGQAIAALQEVPVKEAWRMFIRSCCFCCRQQTSCVEDIVLESSDDVFYMPLRPASPDVGEMISAVKSTESTGVVEYVDSVRQTRKSTHSPQRETEVPHGTQSETIPSLEEGREREVVEGKGSEFTQSNEEELLETIKRTTQETEKEEAVTGSASVNNEEELPPQLLLPKRTLLVETPSIALASLIASILLHLLFALASLLNRGAYNDETHEEVPLRGCAVSLPFQAFITAVSLIWMSFLLYNEKRE